MMDSPVPERRGYAPAAGEGAGLCLAVGRRGSTLLIIFGMRVFYRAIAQGTFHCRRCGGDRQYRHRAGRRWFTLFFIPVIPLNAVGEHVQCTTCRTRYVTDVLNQPTTAQMQAALPAGMRAAVSAMLRSGDPSSPVSRQRAIEAVIGSGVPNYDETMLNADLARPFEAIRPALNRVGAQLTIQAREWYLAEVIRIAMADGPLTDSERQAALAVGVDLGMTQAQVIGVIAMTEQSAGHD
jgi:zinc-ribbon family